MAARNLLGWISATLGVAAIYGSTTNETLFSVLSRSVSHATSKIPLQGGAGNAVPTAADFQGTSDKWQQMTGQVGGGGGDFGGSGNALAAVNFARAQIGKPYLWGASGPDKFDCSGLTQKACKAGGVYVPRTSEAQMAFTIHKKVNRTFTPPLGALCFFGNGGVATHCGISTGDGNMIQAPHTGAFVDIVSIAGEATAIPFICATYPF